MSLSNEDAAAQKEHALTAGPRRQDSRETTTAPEMSFHQLADILRRRRALVLLATIFGTALAGAAALLIPPQFKAQAQLLVETERAIGFPREPAGGNEADETAIIETNMAGLASRANLQRAADSLSKDPEFQPRATVWTKPSTWLRDRRAVSVDYLQRHLSVVQELHSRVISVEFSSSNPKRAAIAANRIAGAYIASQDAQKRSGLERELAQLDKRIPEAKDELERAESLLRAYRVAHGIAEPSQTGQINQQLSALTGQLALAKSDPAGHQSGEPNGRFLPSRSGSQNSSPQDADRAGGDARVRAIQRRLAIVQSAKKEVDEAEIPMRELAGQEAASLEHYNDMLRRQKELRELLAMAGPYMLVISAAVPPALPSSPNPALFIFPALIFSAAAGSLLALAAERLDRGLRSEREIEDALAIPCIGLVPKIHTSGKNRPHHQLRAEPFGVYTEAIRSIVAAALRLGSFSGNTKTVLVTSSVPREGKTTLAVSFAACAALLRPRVILVDFDFRRPATLRELSTEIADKPNTDVFGLVSRGKPFEAAIQRIPGMPLDYLPVKCTAADPLRLFGSEEIFSLMRRLRENYDCVVIDSPPILAVTEARLLAAMADKILIAVQWGKTRREIAQSALSLLRNPGLLEKDCSILASAVVTQVNLKKHARYRYGDSGECYIKYRKFLSRCQAVDDLPARPQQS